MLTCLRPGQSAWTFLWASRNAWSRPGFTRKRTALNAVMTILLVQRCRVRADEAALLRLDHLRQLLAQFRAVVMAVHGNGVLRRRVNKLRLGVGRNRDRTVLLARIVPAVHVVSSHESLPLRCRPGNSPEQSET